LCGVLEALLHLCGVLEAMLQHEGTHTLVHAKRRVGFWRQCYTMKARTYEGTQEILWLHQFIPASMAHVRRQVRNKAAIWTFPGVLINLLNDLFPASRRDGMLCASINPRHRRDGMLHASSNPSHHRNDMLSASSNPRHCRDVILGASSNFCHCRKARCAQCPTPSAAGMACCAHWPTPATAGMGMQTPVTARMAS
jgi:hypothetical protein